MEGDWLLFIAAVRWPVRVRSDRARRPRARTKTQGQGDWAQRAQPAAPWALLGRTELGSTEQSPASSDEVRGGAESIKSTQNVQIPTGLTYSITPSMKHSAVSGKRSKKERA